MPKTFKKCEEHTEKGRPFTNWEKLMIDPLNIKQTDIYKEPFPTDMRVISYKGVYNRLSQGNINDMMGSHEQGAFGQKQENMFDHEFRE